MKVEKQYLLKLEIKKEGCRNAPLSLIEGRGNGKKGKEGQKGGIYKIIGALTVF
ncbi:MAG: hypothetical protein PHQ25_03940 [Acidobacteriota bacterium]|nr:hypothetical protein [Acidobacteriota bacterium]MDW3229058.1 hypothetical protein [Acidobacteriota bacterium]MDY0231553.1 hypothetical protein [Candidatus Saccharicenans sp.]